MKNLIPIITISMLLSTTLKAQVYYQDEKTDEEYEINQNTDKKIINAYIKEQKATAIEFNPNTNYRFPFRLKNKKGNWALFDIEDKTVFMEKESKKYNFQFPSSLMENRNFTFATRKGKTYFVNLYGNGKIKTKISFDEVKPRVLTDTLITTNEDGELEEKHIEYLASFTVNLDNKWGLIELADDNIFLSRNFLYDSPKVVPEATGFQSYQLKMMENLRSEHQIDLLVALDKNGYYFKARNKKTKLWGVYSGEGAAFNNIPTKYTNIIRHRNPETFEVWKDGKVGYYNGSYKLVFKPIFDDFKFVHLDYTYGCALKKKGKWKLYDAHEPIKLVEGSAETIDGLIKLWLNR